MRYSPDTDGRADVKDTRNTHIAVVGLYIAIFAGPKDHKGNLAFFRLFLFFSVGHKSTMCRVWFTT